MVCPEGECAGQADGPALAGYLDGSRRCGKNILGHVASRSCWLYREDIRGHAETDGGTAGLRFLAQRTRSGELVASRIKMVRTACLVSHSGIEVFFSQPPLESPQKLQYLLFGPAAVVAIGIGQE